MMHIHDIQMQCTATMHGCNAWMRYTATLRSCAGALVLQTWSGEAREHHLWISQLLQNPSNYLTQSRLGALFSLLYKYASSTVLGAKGIFI